MIVISAERCNGCGACLEVCPTGALYLVDGRATVDGALCGDYEASVAACVAACPVEAIVIGPMEAEHVSLPARVPVPGPEPGLVHVRTHPALAPLRTKVLPVVGAAMAWAGREIAPRLAEYFLSSLDRPKDRARTASISESKPGGLLSDSRGGGGRRHRRRRREG